MLDTKAPNEAGEAGRPRSQRIYQPGGDLSAMEDSAGIETEEGALRGSES